MTCQIGQQVIQKGRPVRPGAQHIVDAACLAQTIADLAKIARTAAPCNQPAQRTADIGQAAQHGAQILAQERVVQQVVHQRQPLLYRRPVRQGCGKILRQLPRACARHAAIDRRDQRMGAPSLLAGEDLEAGTGRLVHCHVTARNAHDRRQQQGQGAAPRMVEIGHQAARRRQHGPAELAETIERGDAVDGFKPRFPLVAGKVLARTFHRIRHCTFQIFGHDDLARTNTRQHGRQARRLAFLQQHGASRDIASRHAAGAAHFGHGRQHVCAPRLQQGFLGQGACRHEAHDVALHQRL